MAALRLLGIWGPLPAKEQSKTVAFPTGWAAWSHKRKHGSGLWLLPRTLLKGEGGGSSRGLAKSSQLYLMDVPTTPMTELALRNRNIPDNLPGQHEEALLAQNHSNTSPVQRSKTKRTQDDRLVHPDDLGLTVLYQPPVDATGQRNADLDIIAVHGLGAHPNHAWVDKTTTPEVNWIKDDNMLPSIVPNSRIIGYGYDSKWFGERAVKSGIQEMAKNLLFALKSDPERKKHPVRPIVFICHCLGGLIVEKAIVLARSEKETYPKMYRACRGLVLMGTPHQGTGQFTSQELINRLKDSSIPVVLSTAAILKSDDQTLDDLVEGFTNLISSKKVRDHLMVFCFYEQISAEASKVLKHAHAKEGQKEVNKKIEIETIVDKHSAILQGYGSLGLQLDHFELNKFSGPNSFFYKQVVDKIEDMVEAALKPLDDKNQISTVQGTARQPATTQRLSRSMPPYEKDPHFQGRAPILKRLVDKLEHPDRKHRVVLHGPHGIGKTHLAIHYAHGFGERVHNAQIFWITTRTFEEFERAYIRLGKDLNVPGIRDSEQDKLALITSYLSEDDNIGSWLMVLDGADCLENSEAKQILDSLPSNDQGAVLITTSSRKIAVKLQERTEDTFLLPPFWDEDIFGLVRKTLSPARISDAEICTLREISQGLPLAIAQGITYITHYPEIRVLNYLKSLSSRSDKNPTSGALATSQHCYEHLHNVAPDVADLARVASEFNFQAISRDLLKLYYNKFDDFRELMSGLAMITVTTDGTRVSMSPLVRASIKAMQPPRESEDDRISIVLSDKYPAIDLSKKSVISRKCADFLPYAESLLQSESPPKTNDGKESQATLLFKVAKYHAQVKHFKRAIDQLKAAVKLHQEIFESWQSANNSKKMGEARKRVEEVQQVLKTVEKRAGKIPEDISSPTAASITAREAPLSAPPSKINECVKKVHLANKSHGLKKNEDDITSYLRELKEENKGDGYEAIGAQDALATAYEKQGRYTEATATHQKVQNWCLNLNSADEVQKARHIYKVAQSVDHSGKPAEAEDRYKEVLRASEQCLGSGNPEVSRITCSLAVLCGTQGRKQEAELLFTETLRTQRLNLGPGHPDTVLTWNNYAIFKQGAGVDEENLKVSEAVLHQLFRFQVKSLGFDNADTLRTGSNLAVNLHLSHKYKLAYSLCREILSKQIALLGEGHPDVQTTKAAKARTREALARLV
ncbi:hypothetical protein B0J14DRAFT_635182 [Halenospora varia]|nr:hypothetical protein B0J14DRAFT_635182 [Halenospora varia]